MKDYPNLNYEDIIDDEIFIDDDNFEDDDDYFDDEDVEYYD